jgi:hypothetical protein
MPLPLIIVVPSLLALLGYGAKKGLDAQELNDRANKIALDAKRRHESEVARLNKKLRETNGYLEELGRLKLMVFKNQIGHLVETLRRIKSTKSTLKDFQVSFTANEVKKMETAVVASVELSSGLTKGATAGALTGLGAYGTVGALASASTGTAIAGLSGAAASNATLAFLGGGTLAAGGGGVALGTAVLGGLAVAPAVAIAGFAFAANAEKSLTKAVRYQAQIEKAVAEIALAKSVLHGIDQNVAELMTVIAHLAQRYDSVRTENLKARKSIEVMLRIGKALKQCLDQPVMAPDGSPVKSLNAKLDGYAEL